jgi:protein SCO1
VLALLALVAVLSTGCGSGSGPSAAPPTPDPAIGSAFDMAVPDAVLTAPLRDADGRPTDLAAFRGKVLVLGDSLTLCQEVCPLLSANLTTLARGATERGTGNDVVFVQLTVDPERDTPSRLTAYRSLFAPAPDNWRTLTGSADSIATIWKYFGVSYERAPEEKPPGVDWLTGKPLTYDVQHADIVLALDPRQHERFLINGNPATQGTLPPKPLQSFLSDEGRTNLASPDPQFSWTTGQLQSVVEWLLGRRY